MAPVRVCHRMSRYYFSSSFALTAMVLACAGVPAAEPAAPEELPPVVAPAGHYLGALSCASASCHGRQDEDPEPGSVSRREYILWLEHDPHARSGRTLAGAEFERILRRVSSGRDDGPADPAVYERCAKCHDPDQKWTRSFFAPNEKGLNEKGSGVFGGPSVSVSQSQFPPKTPDPGAHGISCESCHGPAKEWIAVHYQRDVSREQLALLGMLDTKNLTVRAELCAGCHVGGADRDMNHDMIAAGHPPLRFELSAYHDLIRHKHWPSAERVRTRDFKARLWAAGQAAAAQATLALVESRAVRASHGDRLTPWPEFAEYDCFACHQRLRPASGFSSVALKGDQPGVPGWQPWNLALTERLATDKANGSAIAALRREMSGSLVTDAAKVCDLAREARSSIRMPGLATSADIVSLVAPSIGADASWAARSQQLLALRAADLAIRDERLRLQPPPGFVAVTSGREVGRREAVDDWDRQWRSVAAALRFGSPRFEWPAFDWEGLGAPPLGESPPMTAEQIAAALARLADELEQQVENTRP